MIDLDKLHSDLIDEMDRAYQKAEYGFLPENRAAGVGKIALIDELLSILERRNPQ